MDFVYSAHLLEHVQDFESALREWWRVIKPGGYLVLYLPHKKFYPNIGVPGSNPGPCSRLHAGRDREGNAGCRLLGSGAQ
jgi:ubiquinone/menaquinone biosynthesis C-methylase UbiE